MSLSSFLNRPDVRTRFREEFDKPKIAMDQALLAPPQSKRYGLVGTAFDYLLRFYLLRLNPHSRQRRWVAEGGLAKLGIRTTRTMYSSDTEELSFPDDDGSLDIGRKLLKRAQAAQKRYLESGSITDSLLRGTIGLAQLDVFYRCGIVDENLGNAYPEDVRDLRKLISLVDPDAFHARRICVLNPHFGVGSRLIGGADADLFIDGALIDIKTTKKMDLTRDHFNQLVGYLAMHEIWGLNGMKRRLRVSRIGIYFARYASIQLFNVEDIVRDGQFAGFLKWFRTAVERRPNRKSTAARRRRLT